MDLIGFALLELRSKHETDNARQAASLLTRIPAWKGSRFRAFGEGLQFSTVAPLLALALAGLEAGGMLAGFAAPALGLLFVGTCAGLFWYEQAFVRAGQIPPLS